jgi:uncharacterized protein (DUF1778 family)
MPATPAHIRATTKYEAKAYDKILLRIRKDGELTKDTIQMAADQAGQSLNSYILDALKEKMSKT